MGGLTLPPKTSSERRQKAIKCTVELKIHAITCPGVILTSKEDVYVGVWMMGQYLKSKKVPPVFPLLLHEKMVFMKTFTDVFDPADIAEQLEHDATSLELVQLPSKACANGEILATFEDDTRAFLYPASRLTPRSPGPEREILMKRSISFPGISPKMEFSTTSILEECDVKSGRPVVFPHPPRAQPSSSKKKKKLGTSTSFSYEKPTVASQCRAPSPYTHRKMCQLSEDATQRLSHLKLGPYLFNKETVPQTPFVVPRSPNSSLMESPTSFTTRAVAKKSPLHLQSRSDTTDLTVPSLIGSFRAKPSQEVPAQTSECSWSKSTKDLSTSLSRGHRDQSPVLSRSSLRQRFQSSSSPSQSAEIHWRVQRVLNKHGARCKLSFEEPADEQGIRRSSQVSTHQESTTDGRLISGEPSVHSDSRTVRSSGAEVHTGTSHRAVFEDSLSSIYRDLYRNATQTGENSCIQ